MALQEAIKPLIQGSSFGNEFRVIRFFQKHTVEEYEIHLYTVMCDKLFKDGYVIYKDGEEIIRSIGIFEDIVKILNSKIHNEWKLELGLPTIDDETRNWKRYASKKR